MKACKQLIAAVFLMVVMSVTAQGTVTVQFSAGTTAGWDFHELDGDIARNNTVDLNDLNVIAQHWLNSGCGDVNQWCARADIDASTGVDLIDYAILSKDWLKQAGENVLLQTIYGTAQDSNGTITANATRALSQNKGMAMAFNVPQNTALDKGIFKFTGIKASCTLRVRLFNITSRNYLTYNHSGVTKVDPGGLNNPPISDISQSTGGSVPSHSEGTQTVTDVVVNFGQLEITAGDYLITFDATAGNNTLGSMVKGTSTDAPNMGIYPDGTPLPRRATVTTSSGTGNTYYYYLSAPTSTSYSCASELFAFQVATTKVEHTKASNPSPANNAIDVIRNVVLSWTAGDGAVLHDIYFGTNSSDVTNSITPTYTTGVNNYTPGLLEFSQTYYWRVDEFDGTSKSKGDVWSFTTAPAVLVPAFPTAEGAGKWSHGGRGGTVYEVTTLQDYDSRSESVIPGSFRAVVEASGARIIVFRISGTIHLKYKLKISNSHITIAGQTAPGDGICIARYPVSIETDHVIIRYMRFRLSDNAADEGDVAYDGPEGYDCLGVDRGHNIIIDHCSTSWSIDELLSCGVVGASTPVEDHPGKLTVQWCLIGESLDCSVHNSPACHGYGTLAKAGYGNELSFHHNLYMHNRSRNPYPGNYNDISVDPAGLTFDFRYNVIYNWMNDYAGYNTQSGANSLTKMNFVGNYYKEGLDSVGSYAFFERVLASRGYFSANWMNTGYPADQWSLLKWDPGWNSSQIDAFKMATAFAVSESITTDDALTAYSRVLADAGATCPKRDPVDTRLVNDVIYGTGHIINDETEVGGWPTLNSTTPPPDSDHDGMPDSWETTHGLNPYDANDNKLDRDSDGYTNIEEYLNQL